MARLYDDASAGELAYGLTWYADAHAWARRLARKHGVSVSTVAGITAALSPQVQWPTNQRGTVQVLTHGRTAVGFPRQRDKALDILDGANPADVLGPRAPKTHAFYDNLWRPTESEAVTIDRHAVDAAVGMVTDDTTRRRLLERKGGYDHVADLYRELADARAVRPHVAQAVVWSVWRNRNGRYRWQRTDSEWLDAYATERSGTPFPGELGPLAPEDRW